MTQTVNQIFHQLQLYPDPTFRILEGRQKMDMCLTSLLCFPGAIVSNSFSCNLQHMRYQLLSNINSCSSQSRQTKTAPNRTASQTMSYNRRAESQQKWQITKPFPLVSYFFCTFHKTTIWGLLQIQNSKASFVCLDILLLVAVRFFFAEVIPQNMKYTAPSNNNSRVWLTLWHNMYFHLD